ncbi:hypothetical protein BCR43DRAFT_487474 [Syncephalastrum racemosum]|uniref:Uncharacterized protein n=1 Tax=Syncephalastrum racemosum TaxID=13706 RepID=A0A1X2HQW9_SYNRA|nr:hypothetical protein BCR43DRAFT_487474 [Syncephalastrum racemosum]
MEPAKPVTALTILYECVSAFACSGSSPGYPNTFTSESGKFHTLSKIMVIILMYRGRHRGKKNKAKIPQNDTKKKGVCLLFCTGLPAAIDHAVLLPSEQLLEKEEREHEFRHRHSEAVKATTKARCHREYSI